MRLRKCKSCGKEFQGTGEQRLCPDCRKQARADTVVRPRECITCGEIFKGGPRAKYCPECRQERTKQTQREYKRRKAAGNVRPLGSVDICPVCGGEYTVESGLQKYCPACAAEAVRQIVLPKKRERAAEHREELLDRKKELKSDSAICAYCGKTYTPTMPTVTCSPTCAKEYKRIVMGTADYKRGRRKKPPSHERYASGLPQSDVVGVTYHRASDKWQVKYQGKYIGLFSTQEEAEGKIKELSARDHPGSLETPGR